MQEWSARPLSIPPENQPKLAADLEATPFVSNALGSVTFELYHRYDMFLVLLTAALITAKYCQFGHTCPCTVDNGVGRDGKARRDAVFKKTTEVTPKETLSKQQKTPKKWLQAICGCC